VTFVSRGRQYPDGPLGPRPGTLLDLLAAAGPEAVYRLELFPDEAAFGCYWPIEDAGGSGERTGGGD
jgi:hypothetical protein